MMPMVPSHVTDRREPRPYSTLIALPRCHSDVAVVVLYCSALSRIGGSSWAT